MPESGLPHVPSIAVKQQWQQAQHATWCALKQVALAGGCPKVPGARRHAGVGGTAGVSALHLCMYGYGLGLS
jgi:hypothetical protein